MTQQLLYAMVLVTGLGIACQWVAWRLRFPAIVLLSITGLLIGPAFGVLDPSKDFGDLLDPVIKLGVAIILFEGGLNLKLHELKEAGAALRRMVTIGVALAWGLGSAAAHYLGGFSWPVALVFGAIIVVTGPTVIMPLLRQARLQKRPASLLKWEGIVNDPIGALLAVLVFQYFVYSVGGVAILQVAKSVALAMAAALLLGFGGAYVLGQAFRRGFVPEFLKAPIMLVSVLCIYVAADQVQHEAGLLATTVFGLVLGNLGLPSIDEMRRFKEYITILLVSSVFILLTADLDPRQILHLDWHSLALLLAILFLVRPITIWLSTMGTGLPWQERALVAWIAPRGIVAAAVAGVFAPQLLQNGYSDANKLVPTIFALIITTVVLHGFSVGWLARRMGLASEKQNGVLIVGASPWSVALGQTLQSLEVPVLIVDTSWHRLRPARLAGLRIGFGEILSDIMEESLELNDIGYVLAASDNDAYNALVCTRFSTEIGRTNVFQLPTIDVDEHDSKGVARTLRGRNVFSEDAIYEELLSRHYQGWEFQKTGLTEEYGYEAWLQDSGESMIPLLFIKKNGDVVFSTLDKPISPDAGDTVISFNGPKKK